MTSKLKRIAAMNPLFDIIIRIGCRCAFFLISLWMELNGFLRTKGIGGKKYASLKQYKNKHDGETCFIIAMGPSMTMEDLEKLKDKNTFGMNSICKIYDKTDFRPTYYGIQDFYVFGDISEHIRRHYSGCSNVFVSDRIKLHFATDDSWNIFPLNMAYNAYGRWFQNRFEVKVSDDIYRTVYEGFSITMSLIQIAMYMGFRKIYLVGADCNFTSSKLHFVDHNAVDTTIDTAAERNIAGYKAMREYAEKNGIKIYNATRGGNLEVFERADFDKVVENE